MLCSGPTQQQHGSVREEQVCLRVPTQPPAALPGEDHEPRVHKRDELQRAVHHRVGGLPDQPQHLPVQPAGAEQLHRLLPPPGPKESRHAPRQLHRVRQPGEHPGAEHPEVHLHHATNPLQPERPDERPEAELRGPRLYRRHHQHPHAAGQLARRQHAAVARPHPRHPAQHPGHRLHARHRQDLLLIASNHDRDSPPGLPRPPFWIPPRSTTSKPPREHRTSSETFDREPGAPLDETWSVL
ncbi:hypothetical protein EYF80_050836 [Liparis tanakae]|uniref:Uncharacterized protein n=1 Tax=Liparis tanakae TaxID=230148 RepID=A0A4Z2FCM0_9TELE|nr:hypothetical protein EYF80_050836 [Liparis tanakae]